MLVTAIDENGMGPQLGPLVVTALGIAVERYDRSRLRRLGHNAGIGDSKQVGGFGDMAWCESVSLAAVEAVTGRCPRSADEYMDAVSLESRVSLRSRCPKSSRKQCWSQRVSLPAWGGDLEQGRRVTRRMARWGVKLARIRSKVICVRHFNDSHAQLKSKATIDLRQMQALLDDASDAVEPNVPHQAICGMVGGIRNYPKFWSGEALLDPLKESRKRCAYRYRSFEEVAFEVRADDRHMPVSLASMIGKYMRELWMLRQNRFYQALDPELSFASGYHDPVTYNHIEQTRPQRRRLNISEGCFLRVR